MGPLAVVAAPTGKPRTSFAFVSATFTVKKQAQPGAATSSFTNTNNVLFSQDVGEQS